MMDLLAELKKRLDENLTHQKRVDLEYAREMGYDAGRNGPNQTNSHYAIFSHPEFTAAWELGKARGEQDKRSDAASHAGNEEKK